MPRHQRIRGIKICAHCREGYDGFKSMETRGHYCSPACLAAARAARRPVLARPAVVGGEAVIALAQ
jgi:hypothetical protein